MALMLASARRGVASLAAMPASRSMSTVVYANYACYDGNTVMSMRPSLPKFRSKSYGWSLSRRVRACGPETAWRNSVNRPPLPFLLRAPWLWSSMSEPRRKAAL